MLPGLDINNRHDLVFYRHTVGLYHGQVGSKNWKRYLSDNMMARDSDFQKAKHIMAIVQNNEKVNQKTA